MVSSNFVSRGGIKLRAALDQFRVDVKGVIDSSILGGGGNKEYLLQISLYD